jgi:hypothetical protein
MRGFRAYLVLATTALAGCTAVYNVVGPVDQFGGADPEVRSILDECCTQIGLVLNETLPESQAKTWWRESIAEREELVQICHGRGVRIWVEVAQSSFSASVQPNASRSPEAEAVLGRPEFPPRTSEIASQLQECLASRSAEPSVRVERHFAPDLR